MRLQFPLTQIKISPVCHIQLTHHAEQSKNRYTIGQLYGALYDDSAHITNILPYPDAENMPIRQQLEAMQSRHKDLLSKFNMDTLNIGWYLVNYKGNLWEQLEIMKFYEKYINTSFVLVYDYDSRLIGKNPYRAYRLTDEFFLKQEFKLHDFNSNEIELPLIQIPAIIQKDEIFELLFLFNKKNLLKQNGTVKSQGLSLSSTVENYLDILEEQKQLNKKLQEKKGAKEVAKTTFSEYCENIGLLLKAQAEQKKVRSYEKNIKEVQKLLKDL